VREGNLSLEGLLGFELRKCTVGVIGTGKIGLAVCQILHGIGCRILAYDKYPSDEARELGVEYVELGELFRACQVITLHCPLTPDTHHLINTESLAKMQQGMMLINTSRGAIIDSRAVLEALKSGKIAYLVLDVYEEEADLFYEDLSNKVIQDDVFARLLTFPNVIVTSHQAFFTSDALETIAETTIENISGFEKGETEHQNRVRPEKVKPAE
jgi:D-lactate dehydrogenase